MGEGETIQYRNTSIVDYDHQKYTYEELISDQKELAKKYSEIARLEMIGKSVKGRKIYDLIIGNPDAKNCILVTGGIHAREYVTSALCMRTAEYYLENYYQKIDGKRVSNIFDGRELLGVKVICPFFSMEYRYS